MGWTQKILRVNLTKGTCKAEPLNMEWAQQYLGQRGLATKYLVEEINPKVDPLSPDNKLIYATGPLTGTMASTGGRYSVITKGALTGAIACSNSGGYFGAELKMAGWDMIIFEGKAKKPVYLLIQDETAELKSADGLWGKSVWETEAFLKSAHQDPQTRVSSIGKAGEAGVMFSCIVNDTQSAQVLEAWMDRVHPDWRERVQAAGSGGGGSQNGGGGIHPGVMSREEAYQVLGVEPDASEQDIKEAYHRLIGNLHPDKGGSTYLAAKINEAKDVLLKS